MSRTKEQRSWDTFKRSINPKKIHAERIENLVREGMPDVLNVNHRKRVFWIENKALEEWPKRGNTPVLARIFEPGQIPFMREQWQWGVPAFVLLRVAGVYYLLDPRLEIREMGKLELQFNAVECGIINIMLYLEELE